ncbi:MAG: carboxypeptidase regulatory-like domain-containing protein [Planctomycetes bacterium]|nr:carboxypeptidase regulatory-like domain-containing protein [Planctomycetota bacterium]
MRPLQVLAALLAVAIVVLVALLLRIDPEPAFAVRGADGPVGEALPVAAARADAPIGDPAPKSAPAPRQPELSAAATTAVLYGTVRSADGTPVDTGAIWLFREDKHVGTASGKIATFAFAGLLPGRHRLQSRIDDQLPIDREIEVVAPTSRVDLELPARWVLTVNAVAPDGSPWRKSKATGARHVQRSLVAIAFDAPVPGDQPPTSLSAIEGGLGRFRAGGHLFGRDIKPMPPEALGVLTLPAGKPVHVALFLRNVLIAQQPASSGQAELTFTLPPDVLEKKLARVRLRVVDQGGKPVGKAMVAISDAQSSSGGEPTGDDGRVQLENLVPGRLDLGIRAKELQAPNIEFVVPAGADLDFGDIVVRPVVNVEFQFDNFGGQGSVRANLLDRIRPDWMARHLHFGAENGKSLQTQLFPGRYGMLASSRNGVAMVIVDVGATPVTAVRFDLRRGADLRIEYAVGGRRIGYEVTSVDGVLIRRRDVTGVAGETVELPPGPYILAVTDQAGAVTRRNFTLPAAGLRLTVP